MVMNLAEQIGEKLKELHQEHAQLGWLGRDHARLVTQAITGDAEARKELASLKQEIASVRHHIAEIERHIDMLLTRRPSNRAERIAERQRHEQQIADRPRRNER
jgi:chromosome segregation ATPase